MLFNIIKVKKERFSRSINKISFAFAFQMQSYCEGKYYLRSCWQSCFKNALLIKLNASSRLQDTIFYQSIKVTDVSPDVKANIFMINIYSVLSLYV